LATRPLAQLDGDWSVRFQPQRGAPPGDVKLAAGSWTDNADSGIRYFSGSAVYVKTVRVPKVAKSNRVMLDLGEVGDIAEIAVNGKTIRTVWKPPYRADITDALKSGNNDIRITIANRWVNRLIGDAQPGATKIGWTVKPTYSAKAPLLPSGMIGPVQLLEANTNFSVEVSDNVRKIIQ
jgi:beta-galactosidase/beta-glucuronidase